MDETGLGVARFEGGNDLHTLQFAAALEGDDAQNFSVPDRPEGPHLGAPDAESLSSICLWLEAPRRGRSGHDRREGGRGP